MMEEFKAGDVVCLKSGGPDMTIESIPYINGPLVYESKAVCVWFENNLQKHGVFDTVVLKKKE